MTEQGAAISQCTALVSSRDDAPLKLAHLQKPCGEPVAELGPCGECKKLPDDDWQPWHSAEASASPDDWHGLAHEPTYLLVHVALGPCEECGGTSIDYVGHHDNHSDHGFAPTVTERAGLGHEAEVDDG